jgi:hypothetical protein
MSNKNKKLVFSLTAKDFKWDFFCSGGPGGQHQNKVATGCRCTHVPSGAVSESRVYKQQIQNKREAFTKCCKSDKFQKWCKVHASKLLGNKTPEDIVDEMMDRITDFKIEIKNSEGLWSEISLDDFLCLSA